MIDNEKRHLMMHNAWLNSFFPVGDMQVVPMYVFPKVGHMFEPANDPKMGDPHE